MKLSQQSIHVIVLGFSSAIITEEDIREEFKYKIVSTLGTILVQSLYVWLIVNNNQCILNLILILLQKHGEEVFASTSNKHHKIKVGTILRFLVKRLVLDLFTLTNGKIFFLFFQRVLFLAQLSLSVLCTRIDDNVS